MIKISSDQIRAHFTSHLAEGELLQFAVFANRDMPIWKALLSVAAGPVAFAAAGLVNPSYFVGLSDSRIILLPSSKLFAPNGEPISISREEIKNFKSSDWPGGKAIQFNALGQEVKLLIPRSGRNLDASHWQVACDLAEKLAG